MQRRNRRAQGARAALEERGLRGRRGMDRQRIVTEPYRDYDPIQPRGTNWRASFDGSSAPVIAARSRSRSSRSCSSKFGEHLHRHRRLRADLGLEVRRRGRAADLPARDGPLPRGEARGPEPEVAGVHPVPRRVRAVHARPPVADGARRDRRADPRRPRRARLLRDRRVAGLRPAAGARATSASSSTCSTCSRSGSSTAARSGARRACSGSAAAAARRRRLRPLRRHGARARRRHVRRVRPAAPRL